MSKTNNIPNSKAVTDGRSSQGQFVPGVSGNAQGRPRAESVALRQSLAEGAHDVVNAVLEAAKAGDMQAAKIVLDRLVPTLKATTQPVHVQLPENPSPLAIARAILNSTASGNLSVDVASQLVSAIGTFCRIEETENLRERIAALEKVALKNKPIRP